MSATRTAGLNRIHLLLIMAVLQLADFLSTRAALQQGAIEVGLLGAASSNPVTLAFVKLFCVVAFAIVLFREKSAMDQRLRWSKLVCVFYGCVVFSNLAVVL